MTVSTTVLLLATHSTTTHVPTTVLLLLLILVLLPLASHIWVVFVVYDLLLVLIILVLHHVAIHTLLLLLLIESLLSGLRRYIALMLWSPVPAALPEVASTALMTAEHGVLQGMLLVIGFWQLDRIWIEESCTVLTVLRWLLRL